MTKTFLFQAIQFTQTIQLSIRMVLVLFNSGATTLGQSRPGSNDNEGVLRIPQSSSITGTSPSDCLVSYQDTHWEEGLTPLQRSSRCILQSQPTGQRTVWNLNWVQTNDLHWIKLLEIKLFDHLTMCKQLTDV